MSDNPQTNWRTDSVEHAADIPYDREKARALQKRREESQALLNAAISPLVERHANTPEPEVEDTRDLEETVHDLFADRRTLDRKARVQRIGRMASRGRTEFGSPLPKRSDDLLYQHGIGPSAEELARFEAGLDDEDEEYED